LKLINRIHLMDDGEQREKDIKAEDKEAERILRAAEIIARWDKKPFYIS